MMIKYRVHELAKNLGVPNKEIIELIEKYFGVVKKHMTSLSEDEFIIPKNQKLKILTNILN